MKDSYFVSDVGDDLHGFAEVFAASFLIEDVPVDFAGGKVRELIKVLVDESFVVTEVEVGFRAVFCDIDLAVLIGAHGTGVDVDIWVELLSGDFETSCFKEASEGSGGDTLTEAGDDTACDEDILSLFHKILTKKYNFSQKKEKDIRGREELHPRRQTSLFTTIL